MHSDDEHDQRERLAFRDTIEQVTQIQLLCENQAREAERLASRFEDRFPDLVGALVEAPDEDNYNQMVGHVIRWLLPYNLSSPETLDN